MSVKKVLLLGNPVLREKSLPITDFPQELKSIVDDLRDTLTYLQDTYKTGRGLAAPQIGYTRRVVYIQMKDRTIILVNPQIIARSARMFDVWDGCFSFDMAFFVNIQRHQTITVRYFDAEGQEHTEEFSGDMSELLQHELDHLDGILATDHLKDPLKIVMREELRV